VQGNLHSLGPQANLFVNINKEESAPKKNGHKLKSIQLRMGAKLKKVAQIRVGSNKSRLKYEWTQIIVGPNINQHKRQLKIKWAGPSTTRLGSKSRLICKSLKILNRPTRIRLSVESRLAHSRIANNFKSPNIIDS